MSSTTAGVTYNAAAYVAAASASSVGQPIQLVVREQTSTGGAVVSTGSSATTLTTAFKRLAVTAAISHSGDRLDLYIWQNKAVAGKRPLRGLRDPHERRGNHTHAHAHPDTHTRHPRPHPRPRPSGSRG